MGKKLEDAFNEMEELQTPSNTKTKVKDIILPEENVPLPTDPEWNDYVMGLFHESELIEGRPVVAGLRRVTQLVYGPIVQSVPVTVIPPKDDKTIGRCTVIWRVELSNGSVFGDVADSWEGNTDDLFCIYSVATAATRAEARALRKALQLRTVAAEEISSRNAIEVIKKTSVATATEGDYDEQSRMTDRQSNFLDVKAKQLNVNVASLFEQVFNTPVSKKISKQMASTAIDKLNEYQQNPELILDSIKGYMDNWKQ